jgi:hypothetical protein
LLEIKPEMWYNIREIWGNHSRQEREACGEPQVFVSADTRLNSSKLKSEKSKVRNNMVLNLVNLHFDIISSFVLRISDFAGLGSSTIVENSLQIGPFYAKRTQFRESPNERK